MRSFHDLGIALLCALGAAGLSLAQEPPVPDRALGILGWVEWVELLDGELRLKAKLDTGALTSSLDATEIERFEQDGKRWIRFTLADPSSGELRQLERPLVRNVRIARHDDEYQRRPVVTLLLCLGSLYQEVEFSLINRSNFIYPVLLGRQVLANHALVDSQRTFTSPPDCAPAGTRD